MSGSKILFTFPHRGAQQEFSAELANKGTADMEKELLRNLSSWFDAVSVETIDLT